MADQLNFPSDRSELDPPQSAGPLQTGDTYSEGGTVWVYDQSVGAWGSGTGTAVGDVYLSKVNDDNAAGEITFKALSTHEAGVNVTGGDVNINNENAMIYGVNGAIQSKHSVRAGFSSAEHMFYSAYEVSDKGDHNGYLATADSTKTSNGNVNGYFASPNLGRMTGATRTTGFYSAIDTANPTNWNFYAGAAAPNYLKGNLIVAPNVDNVPSVSNTNAGTIIQSASSVGKIIVNMGGDGASVNQPLTARRTRATSTASWQCIKVGNHDDSASGYITCGGTFGRNIDVRMGATGVAMADGAGEIVKLLQPKVITQGGETFNGFLPADLAGTFEAAVNGEAEATLAVGTYTDPEGAIQTDVEEPEAIPFGATWEQTGIKDVMQGVSQSELIPLLTKALQEALARLEAIEANEVIDDATDSALLTLVANLATRVSALENA